ncbi:hypothetical protein ANANG_G00004110, partial [Anguilla anguilla]
NGHSLKDLILFPIEQVNGSEALKERELYWIRELKTVTHGLNLDPGDQPLDDGEERSEGPADRQWEESMESPQKGKRKFGGNDDRKSKKRKLKITDSLYFQMRRKNFSQPVKNALEDGKKTISEVYAKLNDVSCKRNRACNFWMT